MGKRKTSSEIDPRVLKEARRLAKGDMSRVTVDPKTGSAYVWNPRDGRGR